MSAMVRSITCSVAEGPFGNPDTRILEQTGFPQYSGTDFHRTENTQLIEAEQICHDIINGKKKLVHVVRDVNDLMAYGIGAMIAKLAEEKLLKDSNDAFRMLEEVFTPETLGRKKAYRLSRRTVFDSLQQFGLIRKKLSIKKAKPGGTIPNITEISGIVERYKKVPRLKIQSPDRNRKVVNARFHIFWVMRYVCGYSLNDIGTRLNRHHTTVLNGITNIDGIRKRSIADRQTVDNICDKSDMLGLCRHYNIMISNPGIHRIK